MKKSITSKSWTKHPWFIEVINHIGKIFSFFGVNVNMSESYIFNAARKKSGLHDFGDNSFRVPLRQLLHSIEEEAQLNTAGRLIARKRLIDSLDIILRAQELIDLYPEILNEELPEVWVIAGLPRTGTTKLHRMLASDPNSSSPLSFETVNPIPPKPGHPDNRKKEGQLVEKMVKLLSPNIMAIHPIEHNSPEEDLYLGQFSFISQMMEGTMRVPTYSKWIETQDKTPSYEFCKKVLQIMQWHQPCNRWVLKSPFHLEDFDALFKVFPQAKVIQTHRDLKKVVPSFCSLIAHYHGVLKDEVDGDEIGQHWFNKYDRMIRRSIEYRKNSNDVFIDVLYSDLMNDPMGQIENIYQFMGTTLSDSVKQTIESSGESNTQFKYGVHKYDMNDFGLTAEAIDQNFLDYMNAYSIPREK